eukprot:6211465-Pleurochrysis_carterae.AAC.1
MFSAGNKRVGTTYTGLAGGTFYVPLHYFRATPGSAIALNIIFSADIPNGTRFHILLVNMAQELSSSKRCYGYIFANKIMMSTMRVSIPV